VEGEAFQLARVETKMDRRSVRLAMELSWLMVEQSKGSLIVGV
jgi:hypothetical protein